MLTTIHSINSDFLFPLSGVCDAVTQSGVVLDSISDSQGVSIQGRYVNAVEPIFIYNASESVTLLPCFQHLPSAFQYGWLNSPRMVFGSQTQSFYYYDSTTLGSCDVIDFDLTALDPAIKTSVAFTKFTYADNFGYITLNLVPDHLYKLDFNGVILEIICQGVTSQTSFSFINKFGVPDLFTGVDKLVSTHSISYDRFNVSRFEGASVIRSYNPQEASSTECRTFVLDKLNQSFLSELICSPEVKYNNHVVTIGSDITQSSKSDAFSFIINTAL